MVSTNGALWFGTLSASGTTRVGRMTTQGVVSGTYPLPDPEGTVMLAVGPDNTVAFSAVNGELVNDVGLVTGGNVTSYPLAGAVCVTGLIATGADGNLWTCGDTAFESNPAKIDRVTPQGGVTAFSVPVPSSGAILYGIAPGPDGALWYVGVAGSSTPIVGRITTAGVATDYSAAAAAAGVQDPFAIVAGPDGALWFTDSNEGVSSNGHNAIGRITTSGAVIEYPLSPSSSPFGITPGPDGALWFTDGAQNAIGRITTKGAITEYGTGITSGAYPNGIATGPDGALWFTEANTGKIGRLSFGGTSGSAIRRRSAWNARPPS
jgi:virginiamycin B lyase